MLSSFWGTLGHHQQLIMYMCIYPRDSVWEGQAWWAEKGCS